MAKNDKSTGENTGETKPTVPMTRVPLHCLTKLSESERTSYEKALINEFCEIELIAWTRDTDGDLDDMYRMWEENSRDDSSGSSHFSFFLDRTGVKDTAVILARPDVFTLCHTKEAWAWGQELVNKELVARGEKPDSVLVYDAMGENELREDALMRALNYGRIPATSMPLAWCNLDISNMDMCELIEFEKKDAVPGGCVDGVVHALENKKWDAEAFGKRLYEYLKSNS
ncbi:hypothetical protein F4777DRAFT_582785 [Nemania sp. FL0916]|nr:hypothetical protein F4777DRAFT_582785 [Nemania sp. FL0916]